MKVIVLIENNSYNAKLKSEHGLSLYIEIEDRKILFDTGKSQSFSLNAKELEVELFDIDYGIISHGHYDHGGGLSKFLELNNHAKVYINKDAYGDYYSKREHNEMAYIGLDQKTRSNPRIELVDGVFEIEKGISLISGVKGNKFFPSGNQTLFAKKGDKFICDTFMHEQNLVIDYEGKIILFAGCAHNGILNIIDYTEEKLQVKITHVFSGLHLYSHSLKKSENPFIINEIAKVLLEKGIKLWTGHCTGDEAYEQIKKVLKEDIKPMTTGIVVEL